jgi:alpha-glucosidase
VRCVVNMGGETVLVPNPGSMLLASSTHVKASARTVALPPNTSIWLTED